MQPTLRCRSFHQEKKGCAPAEYEDAFACLPEQGRFAVADGASESSYAGNWARLLVRGAVRQPGPWGRWLPRARLLWQQSFQPAELPWYAEAKAEQGAHATLLTLAFQLDADAVSGRWRAQAVGDTCLFVVRANRLLKPFPLTASDQFGTTPSLLCSRRSAVRSKRLTLQGTWNEGDRFFLMTDALAQWFLKGWENREKPWRQLNAFKDKDEFSSWLEQARESRAIRNDDVTLIMIRVRPPSDV